MIYCPKEVQLICLSATVANPDELAGWIAQVIHVTLFADHDENHPQFFSYFTEDFNLR